MMDLPYIWYIYWFVCCIFGRACHFIRVDLASFELLVLYGQIIQYCDSCCIVETNPPILQTWKTKKNTCTTKHVLSVSCVNGYMTFLSWCHYSKYLSIDFVKSCMKQTLHISCLPNTSGSVLYWNIYLVKCTRQGVPIVFFKTQCFWQNQWKYIFKFQPSKKIVSSLHVIYQYMML